MQIKDGLYLEKIALKKSRLQLNRSGSNALWIAVTVLGLAIQKGLEDTFYWSFFFLNFLRFLDFTSYFLPLELVRSLELDDYLCKLIVLTAYQGIFRMAAPRPV